MINTRQDAVHKLSSFIKNGLNTYSSQRNFDLGPQNRTNVSNLSPFIKKRIIHEEEVLNECLKVKKYDHFLKTKVTKQKHEEIVEKLLKIERQ